MEKDEYFIYVLKDGTRLSFNRESNQFETKKEIGMIEIQHYDEYYAAKSLGYIAIGEISYILKGKKERARK